MSWWQMPGWRLSWVAIVLGGSCPGWRLSWVAIVLGGDCPGGQLTGCFVNSSMNEEESTA